MSKVFPLYPTPVYQELIQEPLLSPLQEELFTAMRKLEEEGSFAQFPKRGGDYHSVSDSTFGKGSVQGKHEVDIFEELIHINAIKYMQLIKANPKVIEAMEKEWYELSIWMTKTAKGKHAIVHDHGESDISGVYYLKARGDGKDGCIFFKSSQRLILTDQCFSHITNAPVSITPEVGKLMMFPGWLKHGVRTNESDDLRISISFNIKLEFPTEKEGDVNLLDYVTNNNNLIGHKK